MIVNIIPYDNMFRGNSREGFPLSHKDITDFGWKVKKKLAESRMDQKTFCKRYNIPESRLSNIIHGRRKAYQYRSQVAKILKIEDE